MNADEVMVEAVKTALAGGRTYGNVQHRKAIETAIALYLDDKATAADFTTAIVSMSNISALQQKLAKAGKIDRNERGEAKKNIFAEF
jgi:predicted nucleic-acid-binding protein